MTQLFSTLLLLIFTLVSDAAYADMNTPSPLTVEQATQLMHDGKPVYSCSMKPEWLTDQPGNCPCCAMSLEKVKEIKDGQAVFEEGSMNMTNMPMKDNIMEKQ